MDFRAAAAAQSNHTENGANVQSWKVWLYHLVDSVITGASNAGLMTMIDPNAVNIVTAKGWLHIGAIMGGAALIQLLKYLSQGLPPINDDQNPLKGTAT